MLTARSSIMLGTALAMLTASACGYDPKPVSGTLKCAPNGSCPDGYECAQGACWSPNLFGTWTFETPSTRTIACDMGGSMTEQWGGIGEYFDITNGGSSGLRAFYYCNWDLDLAPSGSSTVIQTGQSCNGADPNIPTTSYTWHGMTFSLSSSDGHKGTLRASLPYDYVQLTGSGNCTMDFTGTLTKS